ncbi:hypothetical protein ACEPAI_5591 [Sanghuangporus weigelae]
MFRDPREYVKKYEGMLCLFRGLTASLKRETALLKEQLDSAVRYCEINKLPNELLIIVMDYVVSEFRDIFTLTRVCSRFRSLAISTPKLWANCELKMPSPAREVSLIADMSRGLPLSATLMSSFTHESDLLVTERIFLSSSFSWNIGNYACRYRCGTLADEAHPATGASQPASDAYGVVPR